MRTVVGEWESEEAFKKFADDEAMAETHAQRERTMTRQIRHLFDGIFLLDPAFKFEERLVNNS